MYSVLYGLGAAIISFFIAVLISNTGVLGNGYAGTVEILIALLIGVVIGCAYAIINAINKNK